MKKPVLALLAVVTLSLSACVVNNTPPRDVGSAAADGSIYLGWRLVSKEKKGGTDRETFNVGDGLGTYSSLRVTTDRAVNIAQLVVIFSNGEQWIAPAPGDLAAGQWTNPIALPGAPRAIHSIVVDGRAASTMHAKVEIHGTR